MSTGVIVTIIWQAKPEAAESLAELFEALFQETRNHKGFRNIRLVRGGLDPNQFMLIEEWDEPQDFYDYAEFRVQRGDTEKLLALIAEPAHTGIWHLDPLASAQK